MGHKGINWGYKRQMTSLSTIIPVQDKKGPEMQMTVLGLHFKLQSIIRQQPWLVAMVCCFPPCLRACTMHKRGIQMNFPAAHIKQINWPHIQQSSPVSLFIYGIKFVASTVFSDVKHL